MPWHCANTMPCFTCAAGCKPFTTNFWESEANNETQSIFPSSEIYFVCLRSGAGAELRGHESMELAYAARVLAACDHLLAGPRPARAHQAAPWRVPRTLARHALARPHDGALGPNVARGTRKIPRRHARPLRPRRTP